MTTTAPTIEQLELAPDQLVPHEKNIRTEITDVATLAASMKAKGVLSPLTVVPDGRPDREQYVVLAGHRRLAAAKAAKLATVPCIVRHDLTDPADQIAVMLGENIERTDLTVVEEAQGVQELLDLGDSPAAIAIRTGMSRQRGSLRAKVAKLSDKTKEALTQHSATLEDAKFIADLTDADDRRTAEGALGTNDWLATKERLRKRVAMRKQKAKLRKDVAAVGITHIVENVWYSTPVSKLRTEIERELGCGTADVDVLTWPLSDGDTETVRAHLDTTIATLTEEWMSTGRRWVARVYVLTAPSEDPDDDSDDADKDDESSPTSASPRDDAPEPEPDPSPEELARREQIEKLDAATTVRRKVIADAISNGKADAALQATRLSVRYLNDPRYTLDEIHIVMPFLPIDDPAPEALINSWGWARDARREAIVEWFDAERNVGSVMMATAWMMLGAADDYLTAEPVYDVEDESLAEISYFFDYVALLEQIGHVWSDVELEVIASATTARAQAVADQGEADDE